MQVDRRWMLTSLAGLAFAPLRLRAQPRFEAEDEGAQVQRLAANVFVILHRDATDEWPHSNVGVIVGRRSVFVIDSTYLPSRARADIALIRRLTDKPVSKLATTHWHFASQFRARYPACRLDIDKIYVVDDTLWTSAGMSAAIDLAVGMIEHDHGRDLAVSVARGLVMERRRAGGQAQHSAFLDLDARTDRIQAVLAYARRNLHLPLTTEALAAVACLSPRQFTRLFRAETGASPSKAVERIRLEAAKLMLEQSRLPIEEIARETGFSNRERMRRAFLRAYGAGPRSVRAGAGSVAAL